MANGVVIELSSPAMEHHPMDNTGKLSVLIFLILGCRDPGQILEIAFSMRGCSRACDRAITKQRCTTGPSTVGTLLGDIIVNVPRKLYMLISKGKTRVLPLFHTHYVKSSDSHCAQGWGLSWQTATRLGGYYGMKYAPAGESMLYSTSLLMTNFKLPHDTQSDCCMRSCTDGHIPGSRVP